MIYTHNLTKKGQVTIPKEFRDKLGLDKAGKTTISMNKQGEVVLRPFKSLEEIRAILGEPTGRDDLTEREKIIIPQVLKKYPQYAKKFNRH